MIQLCHFQWSCSLKLAEVNLKHGSEIPIEVCTAIFASGGNNAWWLVVGYMVLTWSKMRSPHSDDSNPISKWFGGDHKKPTTDKPNINQAVWTGISFSGAARWRALLIESGGCQPPSGCPWDWCLDAWLGGQRFVNFATDASHDPVKGALRQASLAKEPSLWCDASIVDFRHCHWLRPHSKAQPGRKEWNLDEGKRVKNERTLYHYMTINNFDQSVVGIHVWFPLRSGWIKGLQRLFLTCRNWFSVQDIQFICSIGP